MSRSRDIRRIIHRAAEECRSSALIARECGIAEGVNVFRAKFDLQVMNRNGYRETPAMTARLVRKHEAVLRDVDALLGEFLDAHLPREEGMGGAAEPEVLWSCWWQGEQNAPLLVRRCLDSLREHANGRELVLITEENVSDYVTIPRHLTEAARQGRLSRTHVSDYLRLALLAEYGGTWLDATLLCTAPIRWAEGASLFTIRRPGYGHGSVAGGRFANYSLGCTATLRPVFVMLREAWAEYWKRRDFLVDYLLTDYLIELVLRRSEHLREALEALPANNSRCDDLFTHLGDPYDEELWTELTSATSLFKLSWKHEFPREVGGRETFFSALLNGELG